MSKFSWPDIFMERNDEIMRLHKSGETYRSIGKRFGLSGTYISSVVKRGLRREEIEAETLANEMLGLERLISKSSLRVKARNALLAANCERFTDVVRVLREDRYTLLRIPNFGRKSQNELRDYFHEHFTEQLAEELFGERPNSTPPKKYKCYFCEKYSFDVFKGRGSNICCDCAVKAVEALKK